MRLPYAAWELPISTLDPCWRVNIGACGEPIMFRRGGSYVTVITGPRVPLGIVTTLPAATGESASPWLHSEAKAQMIAPGVPR